MSTTDRTVQWTGGSHPVVHQEGPALRTQTTTSDTRDFTAQERKPCGEAQGARTFGLLGISQPGVGPPHTAAFRKLRQVSPGSAYCKGHPMVRFAVVMGRVSQKALVGNGAPFVDPVQTTFGYATWVGKFVDGIPLFGILVSTTVASPLMAFAYSGNTGLKVFTYLGDLSVIVVIVAIPYPLSPAHSWPTASPAAARSTTGRLARDLAIAGTSILFSLWVAFTASYLSVCQGWLRLLIGSPTYALLKARGDVTDDGTEVESSKPHDCFHPAGVPLHVLPGDEADARC